MPAYCCVPGCNRRGEAHIWPLDVQLAEKWYRAVPRIWKVRKPLDKNPQGKIFRPHVCRHHFTDDDFSTKTYYCEFSMTYFLIIYFNSLCI